MTVNDCSERSAYFSGRRLFTSVTILLRVKPGRVANGVLPEFSGRNLTLGCKLGYDKILPLHLRLSGNDRP